MIDRRWATVGSSNIDPFSLLMSREANIVVRNAGFAEELRREVRAIMERGARKLVPADWKNRSAAHKAAVWAAYGFVRFTMGVFGYGAEDLAGLSLAALQASFLPEDQKTALEERFRRDFETLGRELFGEPVEPATRELRVLG